MLFKNTFELFQHFCVRSISIGSYNRIIQYFSNTTRKQFINRKNSTATNAFHFELNFFRIKFINLRRTLYICSFLRKCTMENIFDHSDSVLNSIFRKFERSCFFDIFWKLSILIRNSFSRYPNFLPVAIFNKHPKRFRVRRFNSINRILFSIDILQDFF